MLILEGLGSIHDGYLVMGAEQSTIGIFVILVPSFDII